MPALHKRHASWEFLAPMTPPQARRAALWKLPPQPLCRRPELITHPEGMRGDWPGLERGSLLNERQPRSTCKLTTHHRRGEASRQNRRSAPGHRKPNQSDHAGRGSEADTAASGARLASAGNWSSAPPAQSTSYGLSAVAFPVFSELSGHATSASNLKPNAWHLTLVTCPLTIHSRIPNTGKP
jgi:hypothetical protein